MVLDVANVGKAFRKRQVLHGVNLRVDAGEVVAVIGENGAGKTTLLRICAGLEQPTSGSVTVTGRIGYCPQTAGLLDLLTADEHLVTFGRAAGLDRAGALQRGRALLEQLGVRTTGQLVKHMSGGDRQKLNLALTLLGDRALLLLDEPYQGFDHGTYVNFWEHVDGWRRDGKAVVVVTHLLTELHRVDRVLELTRIAAAA